MIIVGLIVVPCAASAFGDSSTAAIVLVDMSRSFAPLKPHDRQALDHLSAALTRLAVDQWDQPVLLFWSTIGNFSLGAKPPCGGARQYRTRIQQAKKPRADHLQSRQELDAWLKACVERLTGGGIQTEDWTDVAGALRYASEVMHGIKGRKAVIILSDFVESLPPGRPSVTLKLSGEKVVFVYRPDVTDEKDPNQMFARLEKWADRIKQAGGEVSCRIPVSAILPSTVQRCIQ